MVTVIDGLPRNESFLKELAQDLKRSCGTGGTVGWTAGRDGRPKESGARQQAGSGQGSAGKGRGQGDRESAGEGREEGGQTRTEEEEGAGSAQGGWFEEEGRKDGREEERSQTGREERPESIA